MNKIEKYTRLLDSVSTPLIEAYNKKIEVDLWEEVKKIEACEKQRNKSFVFGILAIFLAAISIYTLFISVLRFPANINERATLGLVTGLVFIFFGFNLLNRKTSKLDGVLADSQKKLEDFEKVIEALDSADIRNGSLRTVTVLDEVGVRDNVWLLAKKFLFTQGLLAFVRKSPYYRRNFISEFKTEEETLSHRLDSCINHATSVGILLSREKLIRDVQKASGITE